MDVNKSVNIWIQSSFWLLHALSSHIRNFKI